VTPAQIQLKRIYDDPAEEDGLRVLVDRLWPRGVSKDVAALDLWLKDLAPSTQLRQQFNHDPERFDTFRRLYLDELAQRRQVAADLFDQAGDRPIMLLIAARDPKVNHGVVLLEFLRSI
jgi:uncharacterized protein YeaO (DUF488 family)